MPRRALLPLGLSCALTLTLAPAQASARGGPPEKVFAEAQRAFDAGQHRRALELFRSVLTTVKSPNAAFMVARSLQKLGQLPEAFEAMDEAVALATERLATDEGYRATRDAAAAEREALAASIGSVVVAVAEAPPGLAVDLGDRHLTPAEFGRPLGVTPGLVRLSATAPGRAPLTRELRLERGRRETVVVALTSPEPASDRSGTGRAPLRTAGLVTLGLGAAALGVSGATWFFAGRKHDELVSLCGVAPCTDPTATTLIDEGQRLDLAANVALGVGIAGLVAGLTMTVVGWPRTPSTPAVAIEVTPSFAGMRGTF
ncbi:MAG: CDC27 family protein [Deltaproteobacteria bacterium]|nr:CDC27 family protein [Deltaproteobacteria bacterium]